MDRDAERLCRSCTGCQLVSTPQPPPPVTSTPFPDAPWEQLATDLHGPLPSGETLLVTVDYYSRYVEVDVLKKSASSSVVIDRLHALFAGHGIPKGLRTDNGPQFVSAEFAAFLEEMGIEHHRTTPLWPRTNGEVERQNRSLVKILKIAQAEKKPWRAELHRFLLAHG